MSQVDSKQRKFPSFLWRLTSFLTFQCYIPCISLAFFLTLSFVLSSVNVVTDGSRILIRERLGVLPDSCQIKNSGLERWTEKHTEHNLSGIAWPNRLEVTHGSEKPSISRRQGVVYFPHRAKADSPTMHLLFQEKVSWNSHAFIIPFNDTLSPKITDNYKK